MPVTDGEIYTSMRFGITKTDPSINIVKFLRAIVVHGSGNIIEIIKIRRVIDAYSRFPFSGKSEINLILSRMVSVRWQL